ncbi:hypothetical protein LTR10_021302 [Elasticomyces elasticus]|uniref:Cytochrome P450 n=1 Tax=Exophiala sideris TaxID=1016849 RepID=A0ABR0JF55_9EURO|nr:hypothetical protein LTR10_021302 [Elasticomyces elasticus]KAK5025311.1 hypothetical protein LTS07_008162 [Exophiala sideris]KAK5029142.1 hypothetical protein LTR13_008679 [Exophiala sideris]KAK5063371.1 hypothetical protein LTR69_004077 [Exophiala sideris]KAK5179086.1 hypothetical protein LTR44_008575 [Eurotiomycetes sp. CCFEE 6388]
MKLPYVSAPAQLNAVLGFPLLLLTLVVVLWKWRANAYAKKYKLPPRVPGIPIFGNTFQLPPLKQGVWGMETARQYGEMFTCSIGGKTWVFLNSSRVVNDLMEKRAAIYSSRQHMPMAQGVISGGNRVLLMGYNQRWRTLRKVMHAILNKQNAPIFAPFQDVESKHLLYDFLHHPELWYSATQRFANSVIMSVVFGKRMQLEDPKIKELFDTSNAIIEAIQPSANLVDSLTFLEKLPKPLQWWRPRGEAMFQKTVNIYKREVDDVERKMKNGTAIDCFATRFLKEPETKAYGQTQTYFALGSLMEAGSDTSRMTISQAMAAAALDQRWVITAREALDKVCGRNAERLPTFDDRNDLPYITATVKEAFRWRPFAEIGVPHMLIQDDEYEGYNFPAGTLFTWNATAIAMDPREYEEPERFWPERFLNEDLNHPLKGHWSFGPGRRVCSGYNVGESNVWIVLARLLYCFDFESVPGKPIDSFNVNWGEYRFAPFDVNIKVRSPQHAALIEREGRIAVDTMY